MTLQQLRYFIATVESGFSMSRASRSVFTSQPGISKQVQLLEEELGATLLVRERSRIKGLTEAGERVFEAAKRVMRETDGLKQMGQDFLQQESGQLGIASLHTYSIALLPSAMRQLRERYPGVRIEVQDRTPGEIVDRVRSGQADLGLSIEAPERRSALIGLPICTIPRVLLVPQGHPLLAHGAPTLEEIVRYPFVTQRGLASAGWAVNNVFKERGLTFNTSVVAPDASLIKACVANGLGVAIVSAMLYDPARDKSLAAVDLSHIFTPSELTILLDPYRYLRGYVLHFIQLLVPQWPPHRVVQKVREFVQEAQTKG